MDKLVDEVISNVKEGKWGKGDIAIRVLDYCKEKNIKTGEAMQDLVNELLTYIVEKDI